MRKHSNVILLILFLFISSTSLSFAAVDPGINQTIQINTHFSSVAGKPSWLLIIRDMNSGEILPYVFDIKNNDNFWIAFSKEHNYRITVSKLKWGHTAVIRNFCHLEDGVISGQSFFITITGNLTPISSQSQCHILKYKDGPKFTIVNK